jgi:hypothetical protein
MGCWKYASRKRRVAAGIGENLEVLTALAVTGVSQVAIPIQLCQMDVQFTRLTVWRRDGPRQSWMLLAIYAAASQGPRLETRIMISISHVMAAPLMYIVKRSERDHGIGLYYLSRGPLRRPLDSLCVPSNPKARLEADLPRHGLGYQVPL